jgi:hypothetical protein
MARREATRIEKRCGYSGRPLPHPLPKAPKGPGSSTNSTSKTKSA